MQRVGHGFRGALAQLLDGPYRQRQAKEVRQNLGQLAAGEPKFARKHGATKSVGASDAKTHLPRLLQEAERGETVEITRHGRPIAALRRLPKWSLPDGVTIHDLVDEGRRY